MVRAQLPGTRPWWIGANDIATEGKSVWAANNSTGNIDWGIRQGPNGWSPFAPAPAYNTTYNPNTLDCVAAGFGDDAIKWGDYDCSTKLPSLCAVKGAHASFCINPWRMPGLGTEALCSCRCQIRLPAHQAARPPPPTSPTHPNPIFQSSVLDIRATWPCPLLAGTGGADYDLTSTKDTALLVQTVSPQQGYCLTRAKDGINLVIRGCKHLEGLPACRPLANGVCPPGWTCHALRSLLTLCHWLAARPPSWSIRRPPALS